MQERALLALVADPDILTHHPPALLIPEMPEHGRLGRVAHQLNQRAFALVVILSFEVHHRLAFHVVLAGQDKHLERFQSRSVREPSHQDQNCSEQRREFHIVFFG